MSAKVGKFLIVLSGLLLLLVACGGGGGNTSTAPPPPTAQKPVLTISQLLTTNPHREDFTEIEGTAGKVNIHIIQTAADRYELSLDASRPVSAMQIILWISEGNADFNSFPSVSLADSFTIKKFNTDAARMIAGEINLDPSFSAINLQSGILFFDGPKYGIGKITLTGVSPQTKIAFDFRRKAG